MNTQFQGGAVVKTADESVTSDTTLQDDDELAFAVGLGEVWEFEFLLRTKAAAGGGATGDLKINLTVPANATGWMGAFGPKTGATAAATLVHAPAAALGTPLSVGVVSNVETYVQVKARVVTTDTAGTVQLQWAQNASNVLATSVLAGSILKATKLVADSEHRVVAQAADQSFTNSTPVATDLQWAVGANETWLIEAVLWVAATAIGADFRFRFDLANQYNDALYGTRCPSLDQSASVPDGAKINGFDLISAENVKGSGAFATEATMVIIRASVYMYFALGGTMGIWCCQNTSTPASPTTLKAGSYAVATRVA